MSASPPSSIHFATNVSPDAIAEAAELRIQSPLQTLQTPAQIAAEYDKRLAFRRLVDPGIMRPNPYETAMASLKVHKLCAVHQNR
jgi:hypothetical protein